MIAMLVFWNARSRNLALPKKVSAMEVKAICMATMIRDQITTTKIIKIRVVNRIIDQAPIEVRTVINSQGTASDKGNRSLTSWKCVKMRTRITNPPSLSTKKTRARYPRPTRCENQPIQDRHLEIKLDNQISLSVNTMLQRRTCKWKKKVARHHHWTLVIRFRKWVLNLAAKIEI